MVEENIRARLREQLNQWGIGLDKMGAKAAETSQEVHAEIEGEVSEMRRRMSEAQEKLEGRASETSQDVHAEIEGAVTDMQRDISEAQEILEEWDKQDEAASEEMAKAFQSAWRELKEGFEKAISKF